VAVTGALFTPGKMLPLSNKDGRMKNQSDYPENPEEYYCKEKMK
jgi:hypothetical protein